MGTMITNHVAVAVVQVETTSFTSCQLLLFSNYIFSSSYGRVLSVSVYYYII